MKKNGDLIYIDINILPRLNEMQNQLEIEIM